MNDPIDFVVTWVNDEDAQWAENRRAAAIREGNDTGAASDVRYRDWGILRYWFRSVELFCPWIRTIHFVTDTKLPEWLDVANPKLNIVDGRALKGHDVDTYSSRSIESRLHLIPELSEKYVYFNDDFFVGRPLEPEFFFKNGLPYGVNAPTILADGDYRAHAMLYASGLINRHFSRAGYLRTVIRRSVRPASGSMLFRMPLFLACSKIPPVTDPHVGIPLLKSVVAEAFDAEPEAIEDTRRTVFRSRNETAPIYYATMWHLATGKYFARSKSAIGQYFSLGSSSLNTIKEAITHDRHAQYCLNDGHVEDCGALQAALAQTFSLRFPQPSAYERS
ncbi:Stealth CR1 domain-containing protein [Paramicrobacterium chengjingii]|uniref:Stealth CR1 domain-containing protein n=1 Tax=Paramicrobacterium chengjingii TaxID=2769067 RepID=UPI0014206CD2|nr:Stealth CR1 domain-containing protein [Microbacterium chengjingii]